MRNYLFILFGLLLTSVGMHAQDADSLIYTKYYYPDGVLSSEGWMRNGQPDGYWKSYYPDGIIRTEGNRKDFLLDSIWKFYNNKGEIQSEISYRENLRNGLYRIYTEDVIEEYLYEQDTVRTGRWYSYSGKTVRTIPYENGVENGLAKIYDTLGTIVGTIEYLNGYPIKREQINRTDRNGLKQGLWKFFWNNGKLQLEGVYQNNKKSGFFKYYDVNGNFQRIEKWENDILIEDARETKKLDRKVAYHPNGKLKTEAYFFKGTPDGIRREYSPEGNVIQGYMFKNGILLGEGIVDENGKKQGDWKEYYETGELRAAGKYLHSRPIGKWKYYFENGKIEITGNYTRTGEKDGEWIWYYSNGNLLSIENYADGLEEGESITLSVDGDTLEHGFYTDGLEEGRWSYVNDSVLVEGVYEAGKKTGIWKTYYPNGKVKRSESYFENELDGRSMFYWENTVKKAEYTYINGLLNGNAYQYDEEGNLLYTTTYRMGVEIKYEGVKVTPEIDISFE